MLAGTVFRFVTRICVPVWPLKWVRCYGRPVRSHDGRLVEFIGVVADVTRFVRADRWRQRALRARRQAVLAERARIAREMHDGVLQDLAGIAMQISALLPDVRASPGLAAERLGSILELTQRTGRHARQAVLGMRGGSASVDGVAAMQHAAQRACAFWPARLAVTVIGHERPMRQELCNAAAWIVHEAVVNAVKHGNARLVTLKVAFQHSRMRVSIHDNGSWMTLPVVAEDGAGHAGLVGMRERASGVGAVLRHSSLPGAGTTVRLDIPYDS
jgi:signal transduction histidine kinase